MEDPKYENHSLKKKSLILYAQMSPLTQSAARPRLELGSKASAAQGQPCLPAGRLSKPRPSGRGVEGLTGKSSYGEKESKFPF